MEKDRKTEFDKMNVRTGTAASRGIGGDADCVTKTLEDKKLGDFLVQEIFIA